MSIPAAPAVETSGATGAKQNAATLEHAAS